MGIVFVEQVEFGRKRAAKRVGVEVQLAETREPADLRDERARKPIIVNLKLAEPREQAKLSRQRADGQNTEQRILEQAKLSRQRAGQWRLSPAEQRILKERGRNRAAEALAVDGQLGELREVADLRRDRAG